MANIFPRSSNYIPLKLIVILLTLGGASTLGIWYYATPLYTRVGYQPIQPIPFSHKIHAGQLGMDCRYCHSFVEVAAHSNVPTTQVCMSCHSQIQKDNPVLAPLHQSWATGKPVEWVQIHKTPDYVYFNHSVHVNRGVSCVSCHGRVDQMDVVYHHERQSMSWCLDCHRDPAPNIRPVDQVTNLAWQPEVMKGESLDEAKRRVGAELVAIMKIDPKMTEKGHVPPPDSNCFGCHR